MFSVQKKESDVNEIFILSSSSSETDFDIPVNKKRKMEDPDHDKDKNLVPTCNEANPINANNEVQPVIKQEKDDNKNIATKKKNKKKNKNKNNKKLTTFTCTDCRRYNRELHRRKKMKINQKNSLVNYDFSDNSPTSSSGPNTRRNQNEQTMVGDFKQYMAKYIDDAICKLSDYEFTMGHYETYYSEKQVVSVGDALNMITFFNTIIDQLKEELDELLEDVADVYDDWCAKNECNFQMQKKKSSKKQPLHVTKNLKKDSKVLPQTKETSINAVQTSNNNYILECNEGTSSSLDRYENINVVTTSSKSSTMNKTNDDDDDDDISVGKESYQNTPIKRENESISEDENLSNTCSTVDSEYLNDLTSSASETSISNDVSTPRRTFDLRETVVIQDCNGMINIILKDAGIKQRFKIIADKVLIISQNKDLIVKQQLNSKNRKNETKIKKNTKKHNTGRQHLNTYKGAMNRIGHTVDPNKQVLQITFEDKHVLVNSL